MERLGGGGASPPQLLQIVVPHDCPLNPPSPPVAAPLPCRDALFVECTKSNDATLSPALPLPKAPPDPDPAWLCSAETSTLHRFSLQRRS